MEILTGGSFVNLDNRDKINQLVYTARVMAETAVETEGFVNESENNRQIADDIWRGAERVCREHEAQQVKNTVFWKTGVGIGAISAANDDSPRRSDDERGEYGKACIELHTHPPNALHFSRADDADEAGKFRLFALLADIHKQPKIRFRCGVYNHFSPVPARFIGALPPEIVDLYALIGKLLFLR